VVVAYTTKDGSPSRKDRRVERTIRALRAALEDFQGERPFDELSVAAVAEKANINRVTFYAHYRSLDELAEDCVRSCLVEAGAAMKEPFVDSTALSSVSDNVLGFIGTLEPKRAFLAWLSAGSRRSRLADLLFQGIADMIDARIERFSPSCSPLRRRLFVSFQAAGLSHLAMELLCGDKEAEASLVEELAALLPLLWLPSAYDVLQIEWDDAGRRL
jgi:AcrR family transcriptional regulator